eukprot:CAMPEP_0197559092 /NCGR_PEP_ID=MMETSP1320-20131121/20552_1 /TAXON_ID=91990 /ORGANISM="Bolidomonas sp., Strain RCC2347" /LENGTH=40 /DNA_ID= /DNA_START= /DNA_END= /DNA_ORIENTATION=
MSSSSASARFFFLAPPQEQHDITMSSTMKKANTAHPKRTV